MLNRKDISSATDGHYTDFANAVKNEIKNKIGNHPVFIAHETDKVKIQKMKSLYNEIKNFSEE